MENFETYDKIPGASGARGTPVNYRAKNSLTFADADSADDDAYGD